MTAHFWRQYYSSSASMFFSNLILWRLQLHVQNRVPKVWGVNFMVCYFHQSSIANIYVFIIKLIAVREISYPILFNWIFILCVVCIVLFKTYISKSNMLHVIWFFFSWECFFSMPCSILSLFGLQICKFFCDCTDVKIKTRHDDKPVVPSLCISNTTLKGLTSYTDGLHKHWLDSINPLCSVYKLNALFWALTTILF